MKKKPAKETFAQATKIIDAMKKKGIKVLGFYWTLGRFDTVLIFEAPSEKDAMKVAFDVVRLVTTETMGAVQREEAIKLL